ADGGFVIAWQSAQQDNGLSLGIYARRYDAGGDAVSAEFRVNTRTADEQSMAAISALDDGGFVVTWSSFSQDGSGKGVYAQRYAADGSAQGTEFRVNTFTAGHQDPPVVCTLADGGFVIAWQSDGQDGSNEGVYAQRFGADGTKQGAEFRVNAASAG